MPAILTATDFTESDHSKIMTGSFMTVGRWSCVFPSSATPAVSESNSHNLYRLTFKSRVVSSSAVSAPAVDNLSQHGQRCQQQYCATTALGDKPQQIPGPAESIVHQLVRVNVSDLQRTCRSVSFSQPLHAPCDSHQPAAHMDWSV